MHSPDGRHVAVLDQPQHPQVVGRVVSHGGQLDDVGIERGHPRVQFFEVVRRDAKVVVADDPLGLAEPRDAGGDILLQIDVLDPGGDGRPQ